MSNTCLGVGCGGKNRLDNIRILQVPTLEQTGRYFWRGFKMAPRSGRDSQLLCDVSTRKFQANAYPVDSGGTHDGVELKYLEGIVNLTAEGHNETA